MIDRQGLALFSAPRLTPPNAEPGFLGSALPAAVCGAKTRFASGGSP